ncbi:histone-lysine N-methyltransferase SETMAR [Trichonephila clavipes]|nr:histone-lysine N-methyltransferase SETMAR [Trichonephila clavipes]
MRNLSSFPGVSAGPFGPKGGYPSPFHSSVCGFSWFASRPTFSYNCLGALPANGTDRLLYPVCLGIKVRAPRQKNKPERIIVLSRAFSSLQPGGATGTDTVTANYVQFWFRRFRSGIFDLKGAPRTGWPVVENVDKIAEIVDVDQHVSSRSIAQELKIDHTTFLNHLREVGFKKKLDIWAPQQLTLKFMIDGISISDALTKRNEIDPFLKRIMTGGEKWVTYDNIVRKRSWSKRGESAQTVAKPGLTARKGQTLNSDLYCQQLDHLKLAIDQKRPELTNGRGVVFHQDSARPHMSVVTCQKLWGLGWEVLMHPPYSPDLTPSDYHLFLVLATMHDNWIKFGKRCRRRP